MFLTSLGFVCFETGSHQAYLEPSEACCFYSLYRDRFGPEYWPEQAVLVTWLLSWIQPVFGDECLTSIGVFQVLDRFHYI